MAMLSRNEHRLLKELYKKYKKSKRREFWLATDAFKQLNIKEGEDVSTFHDSGYFSIVLDGTHECFQITPEGIRYVENLPSSFNKTWVFFKNNFVAQLIVGVLVIVLGTYCVLKLGLGMEKEPYVSTQTVYQNTPFTEFSYLDIDGRGWLVPLMFETLMEAKNFAERFKGEENTVYMFRTVVMALDPSMRYVETRSGLSSQSAYKPENLYTFYLPDGKEITDDKYREHIIEIGKHSYKVTLLFIDGRDVEEGDEEKLSKYAYRFRIEEISE